MRENRPLGGLILPSTREIAWNIVRLGSLALAVALAYVIRFEGILDAQNIDSLYSCLGILVPVQFFMLFYTVIVRPAGSIAIELQRAVQWRYLHRYTSHKSPTYR